jgi:hypothetical protein
MECVTPGNYKSMEGQISDISLSFAGSFLENSSPLCRPNHMASLQRSLPIQ